ncbi:MAG TPA: hypothetical protein DCM05_03355 [Elusimicrobia bacterium]|nr:hypothetical protein [Elusimicrobiota bacterium]
MDDYGLIMKEYYRKEEDVLRGAAERLAAAKSPAESQQACQDAVAQLRSWFIETFQAQQGKLTDMSEVLRMTRDTLHSTQQRMEGMERENAEAARILMKMQAGVEPFPSAAGPGLDVKKRLEEQEIQLRRREAEIVSMQKRLEQAREGFRSLQERLSAQESARKAPPPEASEREELRRLRQELQGAKDQLKRRDSELESLSKELQEAEAKLSGSAQDAENKGRELRERLASLTRERDELRAGVEALQAQRDSAERDRLARAEEEQRRQGELESRLKAKDPEVEALRGQLRKAVSERDGLKLRLETFEADRTFAERERARRGEEELQALRRRQAEMEASLKGREPELESLRKRLRDAETFNAGFMQRIEALEAERARIAEEKPAVPAYPPGAHEKEQWEAERAELQERLIILQGDLANMRRIHENSEHAWVETMTRQDTMRLKEIAALKDELQKLRGRP